MKQNFFKYVLLGAFTLALGVGFVGCKDYDDDIDKIDVRLAALEATKTDLSKLEAEVAKMITKTDAEAAIKAAKEAAINEAQALIDALEIEGISDETLNDLLGRVTVLEEDLADAFKQIGILAPDGKVLEALIDLQEKATQALKDNGFVDAEGEASWFAAMEALADAKAAVGNLGKLDPAMLENLDKQLEELAEGLSLLQSVALKSLVFTPQVYTDAGGRGIRFLTYYYRPLTYKVSSGKLGGSTWVADEWAVTTPDPAPANFDAWKASYVFRTSRPIARYDMNSRLISESTLATDKISFDYVEAPTRTLTLDQITAEYVGLESGDLKVKIGVDGELIQHYGGFYNEYASWKKNNAAPGTLDRYTFYLPNLPEYNSVTGNVIDDDGDDDGNLGDNALYALDMVQLKVPMAQGTDIVSSDWAALYNMWLPEFVIAHKGKDKNTYYGVDKQFDAVTGPPAGAATTGNKPASGNYAYITDHEIAEEYLLQNSTMLPQYYEWQPDTVLVFKTGSLDLRGVVRAAGWDDDVPATKAIAYDGTNFIKNYEDIDIEELGFKWEFELLDYVIDNTNQKDFVTLNGSVVTSNVFGLPDARAGIGRTPLFRAKIVDTQNNNAVVKAAYIKVEIVGEPKNITIDLGELPLACTEARVMTVEEMNTLVYNALGISKNDFHATYEYASAVTPVATHKQPNPKTDIGYVDEIQIPSGTGTTYLLAWAPQYEDYYNGIPTPAWTNPKFDAVAGTTPYESKYETSLPGSHEDAVYWGIRKDTVVTNIVSYLPKNGGGSGVTITLKIKIKVPKLEIVQADTYAAFWSRTHLTGVTAQGVPSGTDFYMQNTAVPHTGNDDVYTNNTFTNNLYAGFVTYPKGTWNGAKGQRWGANKWGWIDPTPEAEDAGYEPKANYTFFKNFYDNVDVHYFFKKEENTRDFVADGKTYKITVEDGKNKYNLLPAGFTSAQAIGKILYATLGNETQIIAQIAPVNTKASAEESAAGYAASDWNDGAAIMGDGVTEKLYYSLQYGDDLTDNGPDNGKVNDFSDIILNTDAFAAYIYSEGWMCGNSTHVFDITGDYADFWVKFIKPVTVERNEGYWIDAKDGYSWIRVEDVIKLVDWRKEAFDAWNAGHTVNANAHLYGFYGMLWGDDPATTWTEGFQPNFATAMISLTDAGGQVINNVNLALASASEILNGAPAKEGYHPALTADPTALANIPGAERKHYKIVGGDTNYPAAYTNPLGADGTGGTVTATDENDAYYLGYRNFGQPVSRDWMVRFQAGMGYNWGMLPVTVYIKLYPSNWTKN